jgi:hypothetical protein
MRENKIAYKNTKKKLMNATSFTILIAVILVLSSSVTAVNMQNDQGKMNEKGTVVEKVKTPEGYAIDGPAPGAKLSTLSTSVATIDLGMSSQSNRGNSFPLPFGEYMFGYNAATSPHGEGPCKFDITNPGDIEQLSNQVTVNFASGGVWTCDEKWLVCEYQNGALSQIDPETGDITLIGGGGVGLNGLALNPVNNLLYGCSSTALYKIDQETGSQELIGSFNSGQTHIAIKFDADGVCYSWDVKTSGMSYLYTVDIETGAATQVGSMGVTLCYAQDGDFLKSEDKLYLSAYLYNPSLGGYFCEVDKDTGALTQIADLEGTCEIDASIFMNPCIAPEHDVGVKSIDKPADGYALPIINPVVTVKNYGNNSEYTDVQFEIIKCEAGPTLMTENFSGTFPPTGWTHLGYTKSNTTNKASGTAPEASYTYTSPYVSYGWLMTPPVNATGFEKINVLFRMLADFSSSYQPFFYLHYRKNASAPWRDASPWSNPCTADLGPWYYQIGCYGWGQDIGGEFQVRWYFGSYYYYLQSGSGIYIDDVTIQGCAGCAEFADLAEDVSVPQGEELSVQFGDWTPSEWHNESYQNTWEEYPLTSYTLLEDNNGRNDKKQRLLKLYYPWLHDVGAMTLEGPTTGPAQTFPVETTIKNVGQYDECCFKTYAQIAEIDFNNKVQLLYQDFTSTTFPPTGWTITNTKWARSATRNAGGAATGEARFYWSPSENGKFRMYTSVMDTSDYGSVEIEFRHFVDAFSTPYTLRVETSQDKISWTTVWSLSPGSSNVGPEKITIQTGENVGHDTFYVSWTFDGYSVYIDYWYIDDIYIRGCPTKEPEYTDSYCVSTLAVGQEKHIEFNDWTPAFLAEETTGTRVYACKVWTDLLEPMDNNLANNAFGKFVTLSYFHDVGVAVAAPLDRGIKMLWDNGDTDGSNGYSVYGVTERRLLDDIELTQSSKISEIQCLFVAGTPTDFEVRFRSDNNKQPGTILATSKDIKTTCKATGRTWFGYPEQLVTYDFEPIKLAKGIYWVEGWTYQGAANMFWMIHAKLWREECWINYADYGGLHPGSYNFGVKADLAFTLWGQAGAEVFVAPGDQDIDALASNIGTFPERDMTCYAEIYEYYTNCSEGTLVYEDNIADIDILTPLTGTKLLNFKNYNFEVEGLYNLGFNLVDDNDNYPDNNQVTLSIGCDDTPAATTYALSPAIPDGLNGWYISDVEVTLTAVDPSIGCDADGSGVEQIKYQIDGGAVQTLPGETGVFTVTTDSTMHNIKYWSIDNVGNQESQKTIQFKQDQTPPVIDFTYEWSGDKAPYTFTFNATATDATSGMQRVEFWENWELQETVIGAGPSYVWEILWTPIPKAIFRAIAFDMAGLSAYDDIINPVKSKNSVSQSISSQNSMRLPLSK